MKGRIRSATASAKKVNTVWAYPRCRVATRRVWISSGGASATAVTQRVGEQAAVCEEWGGEGEEERSDPRSWSSLPGPRGSPPCGTYGCRRGRNSHSGAQSARKSVQ